MGMLKNPSAVFVAALSLISGMAHAAGFATVWQLGTDDNASPPFVSENYYSNNPPGSATAIDDDYYFAGTYPAPIGTLAANEPASNIERSVTSGDPRKRFHFPLTAAQAATTSRFRVTVDLFGGGAWVNQSLPGFNVHDVTVRFNGVVIATRTGLTWNTTIVATVPASTVNAVNGENILQVERTGGTNGGFIQFDYLKLEIEAGGMADADGDGMRKWFEDTYGLSDNDPADALLDPDGDGLNNLAEFQKGTNPTAPDTDNDGLADGAETATNPLLADTDGDGLPDGAETSSNPTLADTDGDGWPDNIEIEQGTNPSLASSKPFEFPGGAIGFQFIAENYTEASLKPGEPAGYFRFPYWNISTPQPKWFWLPHTGSASALKNHRGQATAVGVTWSARTASEGFHRGPSDEKLLSGMISAGLDSTTKYPATVNLTGIPYGTYDIIVYVGHIYPSIRGYAQLGSNTGTRRYFSTASSPPFAGWTEATATAVATTLPAANYVRFRNLTGASQSFSVNQVDNDNVSIHGFQIVNTATDTDGDGLKDAVELEYRLNPAVADANSDADGDGLTNAAEITLKTNLFSADTDGDGLRDGQEAAHNANPLLADTDGDGLLDGDEVNATPFPSFANDADSDDDGKTDLQERRGGSNPRDATSLPPSVPSWNNGTRTWTWAVEPLQLRWNHDLSMLGAISGNEAMLAEAVVNRSGTGWGGRISVGIRYYNGRLTYRMYCGNEVFYPTGSPTSGYWVSDWNTVPADRTAALGFSGYGKEDFSVPIRLTFTATRTNTTDNLWTLGFKLETLANPSSPVTLVTWTQGNAVAAHTSLLGGSTAWTDPNGAANTVLLETVMGVTPFMSRTALGPADADNDGIPDTWEAANGLSSPNAADATLDPDNDGLNNRDEWRAGTNPNVADTDGDGVKDGAEVAHGSDPKSAASKPLGFTFTGTIQDLDGDGLSDAWVLWSGGKKRLPSADDDGDGISNLQESLAGTDPDNASSRLKMEARRIGNDLRLDWTDLPYKSHSVVSSTGLSSWAAATGLSPQTVSGGMRQATIAGFLGQGGAKYFRPSIAALDTDGDGVEDWTEVNVLGSSISSADSMGQGIVRQNGQTLSGDALALQQRMQGAAPNGGTPGSTTAGTPSPVQASRFLMQATFGPVPEEIEAVRQLGYPAWIDQQIAKPASYLRPYIRQIKADAAGQRADRTYNYNEMDRFVYGNNVTTPFARAAIGGEDQLRQRVAFALSQILVVSRRDAQLEEKPEAMAYYYDVLIRNALGNYRDVLTDITFNPAMGWYLSHAGNQKGDPTVPRYPDENYAREVMQLFTIGLWELNPDGSRKLLNGEPIPTYGNAEITEMARVFTGLYFDAPYGWNGGGWADEHYTKPMVMYPEHHDFGTKTLLRGFVLPDSTESRENGVQDIRNALDMLFRHPNTPPFVCRQLIQFLVTDNPSPAYIRRVQDVFVNDGTGVRGNLAAVVKAILLDPEARQVPVSASYGKAREPVIRTMHLGRLFKLSKTHPKFVWWNWNETFYGSSVQEPMNSPSVFNFYTPSYQAPGEIRNGGLVSPVLQIVNTFSAVSFPNLLLDYMNGGFRASYDWRYPLDFGGSMLVGSNNAALVDQVNLLVCAGNMTARTRGILLSKLSNASLTEHDRVAIAVWIAMTSPEGAVQR